MVVLVVLAGELACRAREDGMQARAELSEGVAATAPTLHADGAVLAAAARAAAGVRQVSARLLLQKTVLMRGVGVRACACACC